MEPDFSLPVPQSQNYVGAHDDNDLSVPFVVGGFNDVEPLLIKEELVVVVHEDVELSKDPLVQNAVIDLRETADRDEQVDALANSVDVLDQAAAVLDDVDERLRTLDTADR